MIMQLINDSIIICIAAAGGEDPAAQAGLHGGGRHRHRRCGPRRTMKRYGHENWQPICLEVVRQLS